MKKKIFIGLGVVLVALLAFFLYAALVVAKRSPSKPLSLAIGVGY